MLLLNPPLTKPAEPPAGIAQLAGALAAHGHNCDTFDLNLHGILYLLENTEGGNDTWTKRAMKNRVENLADVRRKELFAHPAKYQKAILELNRLLECSSRDGVTLGLANYQDSHLSPLRSEDLLHVAEQPEKSLFHSFYTSCIPQLLAKKSPQYIGISINYLSQAINGFALIGYLKKHVPDTTIIIGGGLITSWMRSPNWQNPFGGLVDYCVDGCGEKPLLEILGTPQNKPTLPDYTALSRLPYFSPGFILPFSTSTGCYWNKCSFCPERAEGNTFTMRNTAQVTTEINQLVHSYSPVLLHLLDNAIPPAVLGQLVKNSPGVPWYGFVRITDDFLEPDYCIALKKAGCIMLKLGVESGDQGVLNKLEKGLDVNTIARVLHNLSAAGIATYVYLLFGTPAETMQEARVTLDFVRRHHQHIDFLNLAIFNMPINSEESKKLQLADFYTGDLSLYTDFSHPQGWGRKKVRKFLASEFRRQPEIAPILKRDPVIFTSNHAPFFCNAKGQRNSTSRLA